MAQDALDHGGVFDHRNELQAPATPGAFEDIEPKAPADELRPETVRRGDPRYLEVVLRTLSDRRKLWGLDAPQQVEVRATRNPYADLDEAALRDALADQQRLLKPAASDSPTPAIPTEASDVH